MERSYKRTLDIASKYLVCLAVSLVGCEASPPAGMPETMGELEATRDAADLSDSVDTGSGSETQPDSDSSCEGAPKEGCPCDSEADEPCCLRVSLGLVCVANPLKPEIWSWRIFNDGGCDDPVWRREGTKGLGLCGSAGVT